MSLGERTFSQVVKEYVALELDARPLAGEFEVAVSTVLRWANGVATPHPLIQEQVIHWILNNRGD